MKDYSNYYPSYKELMLESGSFILEHQLNGFEGEDVVIDGISTKALVTYHQNPINEFQENRKITVLREETIKRGSYVKTISNDRQFLIISEINDNDLVKYALMRETNHNLKWIDSDNKLITRPCIWSSKTLYTTGVKEEELITLPDGKVGLQLPVDADTDKLDKTCEFIFNKNKYKITYLNRVEFNGLLLLICEEGLPHSSADDIINEIANRYNPDGSDRLAEIIPEEPISGITYTIEGSDTLKVLGSQLYTAKKFIDGVQDITATFDWTVSDETMASIWEETYTTLDLEGLNNKVGQFFTITATDRISSEIITKQIKLLNM